MQFFQGPVPVALISPNLQDDSRDGLAAHKHRPGIVAGCRWFLFRFLEQRIFPASLQLGAVPVIHRATRLLSMRNAS